MLFLVAPCPVLEGSRGWSSLLLLVDLDVACHVRSLPRKPIYAPGESGTAVLRRIVWSCLRKQLGDWPPCRRWAPCLPVALSRALGTLALLLSLLCLVLCLCITAFWRL